MRELVVDTSILIQHLIEDQYTTQVDRLFAEVGTTLDLYVPEIGLVECANVLWKQVRFHAMPQERALELLRDLLELPITIVPTSDVLARALQLGLTHTLAIYDSVYIALAESRNCALITADIKQSKAAIQAGVTVEAIR